MGQHQRWIAIGLLCLTTFSAPAWAAPPLLAHGVASGDVTDSSAVLWTRAQRPVGLLVELADSPEFSALRASGKIEVVPERDFTGTLVLTNLQPATRYHYRIRPQEEAASEAVIGSFATAPSPDQPQTVTFLWGGDLGGHSLCRQPEYAIFTPMKTLAADFFIFGGDTIYADTRCTAPPNTPGADFLATTQADFWAKHRYQREDRPFRELLATTPVYAVWDDHEVKNDFAGPHEPLAPLGFRAFFDYFPLRREPEEPQRLYRSFRWGKHLELFILDTRQYRDANLQLDGPNKTMLGPQQLRWLLNRVTASSATWKILYSSVPLSARTGNFLTGRDSWGGGMFAGGFTTELQKIITTFSENHVRNLVWLSTDIHVARALAYDPDQNGVADFHEFISGPLSAAMGDFDPLDQMLHPTIVYEETNFFNFGVVKIDGASGALTLEIRDQTGKVHYMLTLPAS